MSSGRREPNGVYFVWEDGLPVPHYADPWTKQSVTALLSAAGSIPYVKPADRDPDRFNGMTALEVAAIINVEQAADGDHKAYEHYLDRLLGKPKQETQNVHVAITYQDYLEEAGRTLGLNPDDYKHEEPLLIEEIAQSSGEVLNTHYQEATMSPSFRKYARLEDL